MTVPSIQAAIDQIHGAGLMFSLTTDNGLLISPANLITPALREVIRTEKAALVDYLLSPIGNNTEAANEAYEPFEEPRGYEGSGWRLAGAKGLSAETLAKFRAASVALNESQLANDLLLQGETK